MILQKFTKLSTLVYKKVGLYENDVVEFSLLKTFLKLYAFAWYYKALMKQKFLVQSALKTELIFPFIPVRRQKIDHFFIILEKKYVPFSRVCIF